MSPIRPRSCALLVATLAAAPVAVDVTAPASGRLAFTCGMDMYRGAVVVR